MKAEQKTLTNFQDRWEKLVDKGFANYESLTPDERIWFNIQGLMGTVDNGGLISHYCNYGAEHNKETIEDLETLGFKDIAGLLLTINSWFPEGQPSGDIVWEDGKYEEELEALDVKFYAREAELEKSLVVLIEEKI